MHSKSKGYALKFSKLNIKERNQRQIIMVLLVQGYIEQLVGSEIHRRFQREALKLKRRRHQKQSLSFKICSDTLTIKNWIALRKIKYLDNKNSEAKWFIRWSLGKQRTLYRSDALESWYRRMPTFEENAN